MINYTEPEMETAARNELICRGCGDEKETGLVVCWKCFKYRQNPWKDSGLDLKSWLQEVGGNTND